MTYKKVQKYIKKKYGYTVKPCWISDVKEICGLKRKNDSLSHNERKYPCPNNKIEAIKDAFRHVGWL